MKNQSIIRNSLFIILFLIAFLGRTVYHFAPNVEFVTFVLVLSSYYFGLRASVGLVLSVMVLSDMVLGNTNIFIFTWSGFLIPALFSNLLINKLTNLKSTLLPLNRFSQKIKALVLSGLIINLFFYFWTNFGVWFLDSWGMYAKDLNGLIACYINALPFLRNQILGTLISIPLGYTLIEKVRSIAFLNTKYRQAVLRNSSNH